MCERLHGWPCCVWKGTLCNTGDNSKQYHCGNTRHMFPRLKKKRRHSGHQLLTQPCAAGLARDRERRHRRQRTPMYTLATVKPPREAQDSAGPAFTRAHPGFSPHSVKSKVRNKFCKISRCKTEQQLTTIPCTGDSGKYNISNSPCNSFKIQRNARGEQSRGEWPGHSRDYHI